MNSLPGDFDFRSRSFRPINDKNMHNGALMFNSTYPPYSGYEDSGVVSDLYPMPSNSGSESDEFGHYQNYNNRLPDELQNNQVRRHRSLPGGSFIYGLGGHYLNNDDIAYLPKTIGVRPPVCLG